MSEDRMASVDAAGTKTVEMGPGILAPVPDVFGHSFGDHPAVVMLDGL